MQPSGVKVILQFGEREDAGVPWWWQEMESQGVCECWPPPHHRPLLQHNMPGGGRVWKCENGVGAGQHFTVNRGGTQSKGKKRSMYSEA